MLPLLLPFLLYLLPITTALPRNTKSNSNTFKHISPASSSETKTLPTIRTTYPFLSLSSLSHPPQHREFLPNHFTAYTATLASTPYTSLEDWGKTGYDSTLPRVCYRQAVIEGRCDVAEVQVRVVKYGSKTEVERELVVCWCRTGWEITPSDGENREDDNNGETIMQTALEELGRVGKHWRDRIRHVIVYPPANWTEAKRVPGSGEREKYREPVSVTAEGDVVGWEWGAYYVLHALGRILFNHLTNTQSDWLADYMSSIIDDNGFVPTIPSTNLLNQHQDAAIAFASIFAMRKFETDMPPGMGVLPQHQMKAQMGVVGRVLEMTKEGVLEGWEKWCRVNSVKVWRANGTVTGEAWVGQECKL